MKINELIECIKSNCWGKQKDQLIDPQTTRDQVLFGDTDRECTGVVTTCFANIKVIEQAYQQKANFIICHEALFWNHGDHTDWLEDNEAYQKKSALLKKYGITVWRFHDYIHSGIRLENGKYADGIFYGFMKEMGWEAYLVSSPEKPLVYEVPPKTVRELAGEIMQKCGFSGVKMIGSPDAKVRRVYLAEHIMGRGDNEKIAKIDQEKIDVIMPLELTDSTVTEYMRDASLLGLNKTILAFGHFNTEEPGMKYFASYLRKEVSGIKIEFVQSGDMYQYLVNEHNQ